MAMMHLNHPPPPIGLLLSGGLDSSILLGYLLKQGHSVQPFYIRSGLYWETAELQALRQLLATVASPQVRELVLLDLPLDDLYGDHWSITGKRVPDAASLDDAVYLPGRNALLMIKATLWCRLHGVEALALAVSAANPFPDATETFFQGFEAVLDEATSGRVRILCPLTDCSKTQIMQWGRDLPLHLTFSCIAPVDGLHCGQCNKCAERQAAFRATGRDDPTVYTAPSMSLRA